MQVSVEKVSNVERRITVVVPADLVEEAYAKHIDRFAKQAKIKGFRPGKAPKSYIQKRFGDDARKEALSEVIQKSLYEAIAGENLKPVSTPQVMPKVVNPNEPLEYVASFEVLPEIGEIKFSLDALEKLVVNITEEDLEHVIKQLQKQYAQWQEVDREAKFTDRVVIDYYAVFEGKSDIENKIQNFPLELGSKVMLPGFEDGLVGAKAGEERTLSLTFPSDFSVKERAGQPVEFVVEIKQVFNADIPEVDDSFIKQLGVQTGTVEGLKQQIRQSLEQERDRLVNEKLKEKIFSRILEQNPIDVPNSLVQKESKNIHDEVYSKNPQHDHAHHSDEELNAFNDIAKKRVALGLLISEYAQKNHLQPDKERVQKRIQEIAAYYEHPREVIAYLSAAERRGNIEGQVLEDQVVEKLMENIPATEKSLSYAELKGIRT